MASIIKIKNSATTGSAPSSLEQGEFAINVADGNLFYGDGSSVKQNFVFDELEVKGNLTAQQYIVSSSVTYTTQSFSSGSTAFGDSADDSHEFTGTITASGNVDFNGDLDVAGTTNLDTVDIDGDVQLDGTFTVGVNGNGKDVKFYGQLSNRYVLWDQSVNQLKFQDNTRLAFGTGIAEAAFDSSIIFDGSNLIIDSNTGINLVSDNNKIDITGNITASSNISASGVITAEGLVISDDATIEDVLTVKDKIQINKTGAGSNEVLFQILEDGAVKFKVDGEGDATANTLRVSSDGTASSPAIAFGTDTNTGIYQPADNEISLQVAGGTTELTVDVDGVDIQGNITSSGNVSASGNVYATEFHGDGSNLTGISSVPDGTISSSAQFTSTDDVEFRNITASGDISASTVEAGFYSVQGNTVVQMSTDTIAFGFQNDTPISIGKGGNPTLFNGNVTASNNLSASGDITCDNITVAGDITSIGDDITVGDNIVLSSVAGQLQFHGDGSGGGNEGILYKDSGGGNRFGLIFPGSNVVALANRASNGNVEIRANNATAGGGGESTVATFQSTGVNITTPVTASAMELNSVDVGGRIGSYRVVITSNWFHAQTTKRYMPFNSTSEQSSFSYLTITPAVANGKLISITCWPQSTGGSTVIGLHINSNSTAAVTDTQTLSIGAPTTFTFSSNNTFSQNDELSFSFDPTTQPNGMAAQILLEYDY